MIMFALLLMFGYISLGICCILSFCGKDSGSESAKVVCTYV